LFLQSLSDVLEIVNLVPVVLTGLGAAIGGLLSFVFHETPEKIKRNYFYGTDEAYQNEEISLFPIRLENYALHIMQDQQKYELTWSYQAPPSF